MQKIVEEIKRQGAQLGFSAVAVCDAAPLEDASALLQSWLADQFHGTMEWMVRTAHQRGDPRSYFPEARSIIVTAHNYYQQELAGEGRDDAAAEISIYARGRDYHKVLRRKLRRLLEHVQQLIPGVRGRVCVDSFPIMEKALAVKAGIGWIGKHTNLIIKGQGSYFFLGEILLSAELPVDPPLTTDYCGSCNRCQAACPTMALETPFVLDARRCISYLTIEHDGDIDKKLQPGMGNWVFGCDICQEVCPWNRFSEPTDEADFANRFPRDRRSLQHLTGLNREKFEAVFAGTPVRRAGYEKFMRNLQIAIRNSDGWEEN